MVEAPFASKLAIGFAVILRLVVVCHARIRFAL